MEMVLRNTSNILVFNYIKIMNIWSLQKFSQALPGTENPMADMPANVINQQMQSVNETDRRHMYFVNSLSPQLKNMIRNISTMSDEDRKKFMYTLQMMQTDKNYVTKYEAMIKNTLGRT